MGLPLVLDAVWAGAVTLLPRASPAFGDTAVEACAFLKVFVVRFSFLRQLPPNGPQISSRRRPFFFG